MSKGTVLEQTWPLVYPNGQMAIAVPDCYLGDQSLQLIWCANFFACPNHFDLEI